MRRLTVVVMALLFSAACSSPAATGGATPTTAPPAPTGEVTISHPQGGTVIYAELLWVEGSAADLSEGGFILQLLGLEDAVLSQAQVTAGADGRWQVTLEHGYQGEPIEATLTATDMAGERIWAAQAIVIAGMDYRPEGVFGSITSPLTGSTVGGDSFAVRGTASGIFENTFTVALEAEDGTLLDEQIVTLFNPFFVDETPWETTLATNGYTGAAVVRAYSISPADGAELELGRAEVTIEDAAG